MRIIIFRISVALLLVSGVITSCTERIELDTLTQDSKLVIFGFISNEPDAYCIELSRTQPFFGELDVTKSFVTEADVMISGIPLEENSNDPGKYYTRRNFAAMPGQKYRLRVEVDFDGDGTTEVYESEVLMPHLSVSDSVKVEPNIIPVFGRTGITLSFNYYFQPQAGTYPGASFTLSGTPYVDRVTRHILSPFGRMVDEHYVSGFPFFMIRPDFFTTLANDTILIKPSSRYEVGLRIYTPELSEFVRIASVESSPGNPLFSGPPANVPSNISNGALGCFGAYSEVKTEGYLPWDETLIQGEWLDQITRMVIKIEGDQAVLTEKGLQNVYAQGEVLIKDIRMDEFSSVAACKIKVGNGYQADAISWDTYFHFKFLRNSGKWVRL